MFGWLFLTPAYSDDPLSVAAEEIAELNEKVTNLTEEADTRALIDIAEDKYDAAVAAKAARDTAYQQYDAAVAAEATAFSEKTTAQTAVDGQVVTVDTARTQKNDAKDALDISLINLNTANSNLQSAQSVIQNAGGEGLQYTVYHLARVWPSVAVPDSIICSGTWNSNSMQLPVCGYYENIVVKFTGKITVPSDWDSVYFAGYTDDGFKMYVDGNLAVSNWVEQGVRWSAYSPVYDVSQDKTLDVEIWWYNGGGPGSYHLGWSIPGGWTGAGCAYTGGWDVGFSCDLGTFSSGPGATQAQINAYNAAVTAKTAAQLDYNIKSTLYNTRLTAYTQANNTLTAYNQALITKSTAYDNAVTNTSNKLTAKNNAQSTYDQSIINLNNAIENAWELYNETWEFEEQQRVAAAIASAIANQPQPTPEPTTEPTPEPTDEPTTEPTDEPTTEPTDEPTTEPTDEPTTEPTDEPTPEPTDEPTPEPTDEPTTEPTDEPTPEPTDEPTTEPTDNVEIKDEELAALIPEKGEGTSEDLSGVIANLTSKDNKLVVLSREQIAAVSQTLNALTSEAKAEVAEGLGIKSSDVAKIAESMKSNPELATAFVEFESRAADAGDANMPYTLADATTEVQTESFLADPIGAFTNIDFEKVLNPSEWGKDMTDDQREKAQEVVVPVIIAGNIVAAAMTRRI